MKAMLLLATLVAGCAAPTFDTTDNCTFVAEVYQAEPCQVNPEAAAECCADEGAIRRVTPPGAQPGDTVIVECVVVNQPAAPAVQEGAQ